MAIDDERLRVIELKYGGSYKVAKNVISPHYAGRSKYDTHKGNDRMNEHGYAKDYARVLPKDAKTVVELGILGGTGLALWSEVYPSADLIGLDIDLSHYSRNYYTLLANGAFGGGSPRVFVFDELARDSWNELDLILEEQSVTVWVDDAIHDTDVIIQTWKRARKFMAPRSVYIIEDNDEVGDMLKTMYPDLEIYTRRRFTAIQLCP
jgi:hypothetical protein